MYFANSQYSHNIYMKKNVTHEFHVQYSNNNNPHIKKKKKKKKKKRLLLEIQFHEINQIKSSKLFFKNTLCFCFYLMHMHSHIIDTCDLQNIWDFSF